MFRQLGEDLAGTLVSTDFDGVWGGVMVSDGSVFDGSVGYELERRERLGRRGG